MARYMRTDLGRGHSRLRGPVVVNAPFVAQPIKTKFAVHARTGRIRRQTIVLPPYPVVVGDGIAFDGPGTRLTFTSYLENRIKRRTTYALPGPVVVNDAIRFSGLYERLALYRPHRVRVRSRLSKPVVVAATGVFYGPDVTLARVFHRKTTSTLYPPSGEQLPSFPDCGYPITDDFNRANQNPIGPPWDSNPILGLNYARIVSNQLAPVVGGSGVEGYAIYGTPVFPGDFESIISLPNGLPSNGDSIEMGLISEGSWSIVFFRGPLVSGVTTSGLVSTSVDVSPFEAGCKVGIRRSGSTVEAWRQQPGGGWDRLLVATGADPNFSDKPHVRLQGGGGSSIVADDFSLCPTVHAPVAIQGAYPRRGKPRSKLAPPAVVIYEAYYGPQTTLVLGRRLVAKSKLRPAIIPDLARPEITQFAPLPRRKTTYELRPPADILDLVEFGRLVVHLTYSRRGVAKPFLSPPAHVQVDSNRPSIVHLAYSRRGIPKSRLFPPTDTVGLEDQGRIRVIRLTGNSRGRAKYFLRAPVVVVSAEQIYYGPQVTTTYSLRGKSRYALKPPAVVGAGIRFQGVYRLLAPAKPWLIRYDRALRAPVVVAAQQVYYGPQTTLVLGRRPVVASKLRPAIIPPLAEPTRITLAPAKRGLAKSFLSPPADILDLVEFGRLVVYRTYSRRGVVKPFLSPPAHVQVDPNRALQVHLAYSSRRRGVTDLKPPADILDLQEFGRLFVHLSYSRRGTAKPKLSPPVIPDLARPTQLVLTYSSRRLGIAVISPPAVVAVVQEYFYGPSVTLAYSRRPITKPKLQPPIVVQAVADVYYGPQTTLARIQPPPTLARLNPPAVVGAGIRFHGVYRLFAPAKPWNISYQSVLRAPVVVTARDIFYGPSVQLTQIRPRPTVALLKLPTDTLGLEDQGKVSVHLAPQARRPGHVFLRPPVIPPVARPLAISLAPSARGQAKSRLLSPAVIDTSTYYGPSTTLTYSRRGLGRFVRITAQVVDQPAVILYGISVTLAPQARGKAKSQLLPPEVIGAGRVYPGLRRYLVARKTRLERLYRKTTSRLEPPVVIIVPYFYGPATTFAPQKRGQPTYFLRPAVIPPLARPTALHLAYSRRGRPTYFVQPPAVVNTAVEIFGPKIELAPSFRGKPKPKLRPPAVVGQIVYYGPAVNLTYSRRGKPKFVLRTPAVVGQPPFRPILTLLAPQPKPETIYKLQTPTVVNAAEAFFGPQTWLVRIKPAKVVNFKVTFEAPPFVPPGGDVCGFDISQSFVCFIEESGAQVIGGDQTSANVTGTTASDSKITGGERSSGNVIGGDQEAN